MDTFSTLRVDDNFFESRTSGKEGKVEQDQVFRTINGDQSVRKSTTQDKGKNNNSGQKTIYNISNKNIGDGYTEVVLKGDPVAIVCQNINNYMGGVSNIWKNSSQLGIELFNPNLGQIKLDSKVFFN